MDLIAYSVVLVDPKPAFLERIQKLLEGFPPPNTLDYLYHPEENSVYLTPHIGNFLDPWGFEKYINDLKPKFLKSELIRFLVHDNEKIDREFQNMTFDEYFTITIRDYIVDTSEM